jgi:hypothetical protein
MRPPSPPPPPPTPEEEAVRYREREARRREEVETQKMIEREERRRDEERRKWERIQRENEKGVAVVSEFGSRFEGDDAANADAAWVRSRRLARLRNAPMGEGSGSGSGSGNGSRSVWGVPAATPPPPLPRAGPSTVDVEMEAIWGKTPTLGENARRN